MLMTDGIIDPSRRARRRATSAWIARVFWLIVFAAGLYGAFRFGGEQNRAALDHLTTEHANQGADLAAQKAKVVTLTASADTAARKLADLELRYDQNVPKGEAAALVALLNLRLKDGVSADRLAFVLEHLSPDQTCTALDPHSLVITTPLVRGRNVNVSYESGRLTVSGTGQSAQGESGSPESWYDPSAIVAIRLTPIDGEDVTLLGKLPLQKTIVTGNARLNLLIAEGDRGRVNITGERCVFP